MKHLVVNADDFGFTPDVNQGIVEAHRRGILTAATLMANGDAFDDAVRLARETPTLDIGCHLVLIGGRSLLTKQALHSPFRNCFGPWRHGGFAFTMSSPHRCGEFWRLEFGPPISTRTSTRIWLPRYWTRWRRSARNSAFDGCGCRRLAYCAAGFTGYWNGMAARPRITSQGSSLPAAWTRLSWSSCSARSTKAAPS